MSIEELESEAMKLEPKARARLAGKLLESLESLSEEENERVWADEASRRDSDLDSEQDGGEAERASLVGYTPLAERSSLG